jgi:hypothetical protein
MVMNPGRTSDCTLSKITILHDLGKTLREAHTKSALGRRVVRNRMFEI